MVLKYSSRVFNNCIGEIGGITVFHFSVIMICLSLDFGVIFCSYAVNV